MGQSASGLRFTMWFYGPLVFVIRHDHGNARSHGTSPPFFYFLTLTLFWVMSWDKPATLKNHSFLFGPGRNRQRDPVRDLDQKLPSHRRLCRYM